MTNTVTKYNAETFGQAALELVEVNASHDRCYRYVHCDRDIIMEDPWNSDWEVYSRQTGEWIYINDHIHPTVNFLLSLHRSGARIRRAV